MDFQEYKNYVQEPEYPSQKFVRAERFFRNRGYDFIVKRKHEWAVILLATKDRLKRILNISEIDVRQIDVDKFLCDFYKDSLDMIKFYEQQKEQEKSKFIVGEEEDAKFVLNGKEVELKQGQKVVVTE